MYVIWSLLKRSALRKSLQFTSFFSRLISAYFFLFGFLCCHLHFLSS